MNKAMNHLGMLSRKYDKVESYLTQEELRLIRQITTKIQPEIRMMFEIINLKTAGDQEIQKQIYKNEIKYEVSKLSNLVEEVKHERS